MCPESSVKEALQHHFEVPQVLFVGVARDDDIVDDALRAGDTGEELVHHPLPHGWRGGNSECQAVQPVKPLVCVQRQELLGLFIHLHLEVGTSQVDLGEMFSTTKRGENVVDPWQRILVHLQLRVYSNFEVPANSDRSILLRNRDDRCRPVAVSDLGENSIFLQSVEFLANSVTHGIGQRSCLHELWFSIVAERQMSTGRLQMTSVGSKDCGITTLEFIETLSGLGGKFSRHGARFHIVQTAPIEPYVLQPIASKQRRAIRVHHVRLSLKLLAIVVHLCMEHTVWPEAITSVRLQRRRCRLQIQVKMFIKHTGRQNGEGRSSVKFHL